MFSTDMDKGKEDGQEEPFEALTDEAAAELLSQLKGQGV